MTDWRPRVRRPLGWSVPIGVGLRGAGLGNEVIPWAKAYLGGQALGLPWAHPAWGLNVRGYRRDFGTSRMDWLAQRAAAAALPVVDITWDHVRATGEHDYLAAVGALREELALDRRPLVVRHVSGMAGGFLTVRRARSFLLSRVLAPPHVPADLDRIAGKWDEHGGVRVAVHIRGGDFRVAAEGPGPGTFNQAVPERWYVEVCRALSEEFGAGVSFLVLTDDESDPVVRRLTREVGAILPPPRRQPVLSDIAAMASADLLVCSVSSLSMFGAFLSTAPYLWYAPHLEVSDGWRSIWGMEADQQAGATARNRRNADADPPLPRGIPVAEDATLPGPLIRRLREAVELRDPRHDLLLYGVVR